MGFNSVVIVMHDALNEIKEDKEFGEKLYYACLRDYEDKPRDIQSGCSVNAATVVATAHADLIHLIAAGGNYGSIINTMFERYYHHGDKEAELKLLKKAASELGYRLVKKPKKGL